MCPTLHTIASYKVPAETIQSECAMHFCCCRVVVVPSTVGVGRGSHVVLHE